MRAVANAECRRLFGTNHPHIPTLYPESAQTRHARLRDLCWHPLGVPVLDLAIATEASVIVPCRSSWQMARYVLVSRHVAYFCVRC